MSQMCPSSSLVAAAVAFHRARQKFPQNSTACHRPKFGHQLPNNVIKNVEQTMMDTASEDNVLSTPPSRDGCRCRKNCGYSGNIVHQAKSNNCDSIGVDGPSLENIGDQVINGEKRQVDDTRLRAKNRKSISSSGDFINLLYNDVSTHNGDSGDNDGVPSKLHEWRTREALPLMKMQRFPQPLSQLSGFKRDLHQSHKKKPRHYEGRSTSPFLDLLSKPEIKTRKENRVFCHRCQSNNSEGNIEDVWTSGKSLSRHRDSLDILVEKLKSKSHGKLKNQGKEMGIDESLSCERVLLDRKTPSQREYETCCTRKKLLGCGVERKVSHKLCPHCSRQRGLRSRLT